MSSGSRQLATWIEQQFHVALKDCGEISTIGGYQLFFWQRSHPFYRHVAVPTSMEALDGRNIAKIRDAFRQRDIRLNLEFLSELWPSLTTCLTHQGLVESSRLPVLALTNPPETVHGAESQAVIVLDRAGVAPRTNEDRIFLVRSYLRAAYQAFDSSIAPQFETEVTSLCDDLASGRSMLALVKEGKETIAGACLCGIGLDAEMVGVWTDPDHRRQGLADLVCRALIDRFFSWNRRMIWLFARNQQSRDLYLRYGFREVGTQVTVTSPG